MYSIRIVSVISVNNEEIELTVPDFIISLYLSVFQSCTISRKVIVYINFVKVGLAKLKFRSALYTHFGSAKILKLTIK
jgi:hypothetical protein